ncbi:MAG TPA: hypothetical protein VFR23_07565 [Jiangellaceae bacterium]|nr:hypothetical protein [Jiangellaceae bacterium]
MIGCQTEDVSRLGWFSAVAIGLLVWSVYWGIRIEKRLAGQLVSLARNNSWRGAAIAFGVHASALGGFLLLWLLGSLIGSIAGDTRWAAVTVVPAALLYGPLLIVAFPTAFSGFSPARRNLQREGASRGVARAIAWGGGPVAFIGLLCIVEALRQTFLP